MGTVVTEGDYTQIGTGHQQIIHNITNNNPHYTINISVNATSSQQGPRSISASGDEQLMNSLHNMLQSASHVSDTPTQCEPCRAYHERGHQPVVAEDTPIGVISNIERFLDHYGEEILPGNVVIYEDTEVHGIYLGKGELARADSRTQKVVREKLDMKRPIVTFNSLMYGCKSYPREQRLQRALQCIGKKCPGLEGGGDFVCWVYTGYSWWE